MEGLVELLLGGLAVAYLVTAFTIQLEYLSLVCPQCQVLACGIEALL